MNEYFVEQIPKSGEKLPFRYHSHVAFPSNDNIQHSLHIHSYIEILYCISGQCTVFLNEKSYLFESGDMVFVNANTPHHLKCKTKESFYKVLQFDPDILNSASQLGTDYKYMLPFIINQKENKCIFKADELKKTFIPKAIYDIISETDKENFGFELAVRINFERIYLWVIRKQYENIEFIKDLSSETAKKIMNAFDYIWENYFLDLTASDIAKRCYMSYNYFLSEFKNLTGMGFPKYLNQVRILQSKKLLMAGKYSINEIAGRCGYSTTSYFITQFKKETGISPNKFRNDFIKNN